MEVSESMEINGKRTFGYDDPIVYKRVRAGVESKYNSQGQRESWKKFWGSHESW